MIKKSFAGVFLVILILFGLAFASSTLNTVIGETPSSGIINSDTTWTKANSPYTLTGAVGIPVGVTLTIEAGATVNFNGYKLEINGTLIAKGTSNNRIQFNSGQIQFNQESLNWTEQTGLGCIVENALLSSTNIEIRACSPKINANDFRVTSSIYTSRGSPLITNNSFMFSDYTVSGIDIIDSNATVSNNTVCGALIGIHIETDSNKCCPFIERNLLIGNRFGIRLTALFGESSFIPTIRYNTISSNETGIDFDIFSSNYASSLIICYNNIVNNQKYSVNLFNGLSGVRDNVNATYNWWGTTDLQAINQTIYDYKSDYNLGNVSFVPLLDSPNTIAPTYVNSSAGTGGSISPNGITRLDYGDAKSFTANANSGYHLSDIAINGVSIGAVTSFIVENITKPTIVTARFTADSTPTPTAQPTSNPTSNPTATPTSTPSSTVPSSPTPTPTSSPTDDGTWFLSLSNSALLILAIVAVIVIIGIITLIVFIKLRK